MRVVVQKHTLEPHEAAVPQALTGKPVGQPSAAGLGAHVQRFHLERGDYSRWFREMIKDDDLARAAEPIEANSDLSLADSRARIRDAIEARYTLPGTLPTGSAAEEPE